MILTIEQLEKCLKEKIYHTVKLVPLSYYGIDLMEKTQKKLYEQAIKKMTNNIENKDNFKDALIFEYLFRSSQSHLKKQQKEEADDIMSNISHSKDKLSNNDQQIFYNIVENNKIIIEL